MNHIDEKSALALLGGSEKLYIKLMTSFYEKYLHLQGEFETLMLESNVEEARRLAHSIKGLCGNLGAHKLQGLSKDLEYAFRDSSDTYMDILPKFYSEFQLVINEIPEVIVQLGGSLEKKEIISEVSTEKRQYHLLLTQLYEALSMFKYSEVKSVYSSVKTYAIPDDYKDVMHKVYDAIDHFDYKEASGLLESILKND